MKLKNYPLLGTSLVKHFDHSEIYTPSDVPAEWLELEIVHKYIDNRYNKRVIVVRWIDQYALVVHGEHLARGPGSTPGKSKSTNDLRSEQMVDYDL